MSRTRILGALIAAAALTLSACGSSSDGTPSAAESPTTSVTDSAADDEADDTADDTTDDAADDAAETDDTETGAAGDGAPTDLDAQSAAWFTTFCGIGEPFDNFFGAMMGAAMVGAGGDEATAEQLVDARDSMVTAFADLGDAMSKVSGDLEGMPPPTFDGGADAASQAVTGLAQAGPYLSEVAERMSELDTSSSDAFTAELTELMDSVGDMGESLGVDEIDFDDDTMAAIEALPACSGSMLFSNF